VMLVGSVLMLLSGFFFSATGWFGAAGPPPTAPQTIVCLMLLGFVIAARRALHGFKAVLVGIGIGSRIARMVLPYAIGLPFVLVLAQTWVAANGLLDAAYATGISLSLKILMFLGIVIWMALRINLLESELRHMSLADELTGIHNRRGFRLLAEQALRVAHRERLPALLFFFDLDGLKRINDTLGHDAGSDFLRKVADVLSTSFRDGDVVARIGGDEFVVLAIDHDLPAEQTLRRVEARAAAIREREGLPYELAFSSGCARVDFNDDRALDKALQLADERMYAAKKARKAARDSAAA
jgi:diguanylate cyclase (GGDEF)-like protein